MVIRRYARGLAALLVLLAALCMGCKPEDEIVPVVRTPEPGADKLVEVHNEVVRPEHIVTVDGASELALLPDAVELSVVLRFRADSAENASSLVTIGRAHVSRAMRTLGVAAADISFGPSSVRELTGEDELFFAEAAPEDTPESAAAEDMGDADASDPEAGDGGEAPGEEGAEDAGEAEAPEEAIVYTHMAECTFTVMLRSVETLARARRQIDEVENLYVSEVQTVYMLSDYEQAYRDALTAALENARLKAEALAEAGGGRLGKLAMVMEAPRDTEAVLTSEAADVPIILRARLSAGYVVE